MVTIIKLTKQGSRETAAEKKLFHTYGLTDLTTFKFISLEHFEHSNQA